MNDTRVRGIQVYPMPLEICGPFSDYALLVREDGEVRMVHSEGVAYSVTAEKPWRWNDYGPCEEFSAHQLITFAFYSKPVDLADWVRVFGARLESNFGQIVRWNSEAPHIQQCEWSHEVSDAEFGYWNSAWGDPPVHEFTCDKPATVILEFAGMEGTEEIGFCAEHALEAQPK